SETSRTPCNWGILLFPPERAACRGTRSWRPRENPWTRALEEKAGCPQSRERIRGQRPLGVLEAQDRVSVVERGLADRQAPHRVVEPRGDELGADLRELGLERGTLLGVERAVRDAVLVRLQRLRRAPVHVPGAVGLGFQERLQVRLGHRLEGGPLRRPLR